MVDQAWHKAIKGHPNNANSVPGTYSPTARTAAGGLKEPGLGHGQAVPNKE